MAKHIPKPHKPSNSRYIRGCRHRDCKMAHAIYSRMSRKRRLKKQETPDGISSR